MEKEGGKKILKIGSKLGSSVLKTSLEQHLRIFLEQMVRRQSDTHHVSKSDLAAGLTVSTSLSIPLTLGRGDHHLLDLIAGEWQTWVAKVRQTLLCSRLD